MKSPFPATSNWRYERMALAAVVSAVLIAMGLTFSSAALDAAAFVPERWSFPPNLAVLRLWAIATEAAALLSLGVAFLCFTVIKVEPSDKERYYPLRVWIREVGFMWVWLALFLAGLWVIVNIALRFTR